MAIRDGPVDDDAVPVCTVVYVSGRDLTSLKRLPAYGFTWDITNSETCVVRHASSNSDRNLNRCMRSSMFVVGFATISSMQRVAWSHLASTGTIDDMRFLWSIDGVVICLIGGTPITVKYFMQFFFPACKGLHHHLYLTSTPLVPPLHLLVTL